MILGKNGGSEYFVKGSIVNNSDVWSALGMNTGGEVNIQNLVVNPITL